jgi:DNA-binding NarL/FixJ family response regulator
MTSVLIADDQELVRTGFRVVLESEGIEVVGEAANGREAIELAARLRPDVVLMDVRMPELDGIEATRRIVGDGLPTRVLVLTTFDEDQIVYEALRAGAGGFLLKSAPPPRLVEAVRLVAAGEELLAPSVTRRLIEQYVRQPPVGTAVPAELGELTEREREVLQLVAGGLTNGEIAARLVVSEATVKTHVNHLFQKLGLRDRVQAVVLAYETGLVRPGAAQLR